MQVFDKVINALQHSMDFRLQRHNLLSSNLANSDTPGYTPVDIDFNKELESALNGGSKISTTNSKHIPVSSTQVQGHIFADPQVSASGDMNTVDLDREMAKLSVNTLLYNANIKAVTKKMAILKYAITEGGR